MVDLPSTDTTISVISLNVNGLNTDTESQIVGLDGKIPIICGL